MSLPRHWQETIWAGRWTCSTGSGRQPGQKDLRGWEWRYLWQQTRSDASFTLCQESTEINSLAVSSDGSLLAVGVRHRDGLSVWDLRSRQELVRLATQDVEFVVKYGRLGRVHQSRSLKRLPHIHHRQPYLFGLLRP